MAKKCFECGSPLVREKRAESVSYGGMTTEVAVEADWCTNTNCTDGILDSKALAVLDMARTNLKAKVVGVLSPREIAAVRKGLGLSQRAAGEVLGGGSMAFNKYENGKQTPSSGMSNLLRVLEQHPEHLSILRAS